MTQKELTIRNLGQSLDDLMNLDPRGYGVCKILYEASRRYTGEPLTANAAKKLNAALQAGDYVYIITGFVLRPFGSAETDGIIGSMLLARSLVKAFAVRPVIICQEENIPAVEGLARLIGLHYFDSVEKMGDMPASLAYHAFTKDRLKADEESESLMRSCMPKAVITVEAPGANERGAYHNAVGLDITPLEAKMDVLFEQLIMASGTRWGWGPFRSSSADTSRMRRQGSARANAAAGLPCAPRRTISSPPRRPTGAVTGFLPCSPISAAISIFFMTHPYRRRRWKEPPTAV